MPNVILVFQFLPPKKLMHAGWKINTQIKFVYTWFIHLLSISCELSADQWFLPKIANLLIQSVELIELQTTFNWRTFWMETTLSFLRLNVTDCGVFVETRTCFYGARKKKLKYLTSDRWQLMHGLLYQRHEPNASFSSS